MTWSSIANYRKPYRARVQFTDRELMTINSALAFYESSFDDPAPPFGLTVREADQELRASARARTKIKERLESP